MRRKWRCNSHSLRNPPGHITRHALEWNPQGKRGVGNPKMTFLEEEIKACNVTWGELKQTAHNRVRWRTVTEALCSSRNLKE